MCLSILISTNLIRIKYHIYTVHIYRSNDSMYICRSVFNQIGFSSVQNLCESVLTGVKNLGHLWMTPVHEGQTDLFAGLSKFYITNLIILSEKYMETMKLHFRNLLLQSITFIHKYM